MQRPFSQKPVFGSPRRRSPKRSADDIASDILSPNPRTPKSAFSAPGTDPIDLQPFQIDDVGLAGESDRLNAFPDDRQSRGQLSQQAQGPGDLLISPQADSLTQPLGGRPNRNNANLDTFALGQAGVSAGRPAGPSSTLPPEVETIEDYRRLVETGSVSGEKSPALAFELANRVGSHIAGGILAQAGPGGAAEPGEETQKTFGETIGNILSLGTLYGSGAVGYKKATDAIKGLREVDMREVVTDDAVTAKIADAQEARNAGLDALAPVADSINDGLAADASGKRGKIEISKTTNDRVALGQAISGYVRDKHLEALAEVANDPAKKKELGAEFVAAGSQDLKPDKAKILLDALDKIFPDIPADSDLAKTREALAKRAKASTKKTQTPKAAVDALKGHKAKLEAPLPEIESDIERLATQRDAAQAKLTEVSEKLKAVNTQNLRSDDEDEKESLRVEYESLETEQNDLRKKLEDLNANLGPLTATVTTQKRLITKTDEMIKHYESK